MKVLAKFFFWLASAHLHWHAITPGIDICASIIVLCNDFDRAGRVAHTQPMDRQKYSSWLTSSRNGYNRSQWHTSVLDMQYNTILIESWCKNEHELSGGFEDLDGCDAQWPNEIAFAVDFAHCFIEIQLSAFFSSNLDVRNTLTDIVQSTVNSILSVIHTHTRTHISVSAIFIDFSFWSFVSFLSLESPPN